MRNVVLSGRPLVPPNAKGCELPTTRGPRLISPRSYSQPACASSGCPCNKCLPRTCSLALSYPRVVATKRSRRRMRWMSTLICCCCCCCGCRTGGPACGRQFPPQSPWLWMGDVISPAHSSSPAATLLSLVPFCKAFHLWPTPGFGYGRQLHLRLRLCNCIIAFNGDRRPLD